MNISKIKSAITVALLSGATQISFAQTRGFVQEEAIKVAGITTNDQVQALGNSQRQVSRTFVDGLGRPIQQIAIQASPTGKDLIQPIKYDNLGRQTTGYLPYAATTGTGLYHPNALPTEQANFYNNATDTVADDSAPYTQQVFENSPLQRLLTAGMVGSGFQPVAGQHYKTVTYRNNIATDTVILYSPTGVSTGVYPANALTVTDAVDEDNGRTLIFKDVSGRVLLKRQVLSATQKNDTYYVYNNAGAISFIIPPKAGALIKKYSYTLSTTSIKNLIFSYAYDDKGRLIEKKVPAAAVLYVVYDPLDRPVLMQDGNLRAANKWNYIKYDVKGHAISQGIYTDATRTTRATMQTYVDGLTGYATTWYESRSTTAATNYYTNAVFPTTGTEPLAFSYYDHYDLDLNGTANYSYQSQSLPGEAAQADLIRGMPTMVIKRTVGSGLSNIWLTSVIFYDKRGLPIQTQSNNHLNYTANITTDNSTTVYDFTGKTLINKVKLVTSVTDSVRTNFKYDSNNNYLTSVEQRYNAQATVTIATYSYNSMGQLTTKKLGKTAGGSYLQTLDYRFNIRGQMVTLNDSKLSTTDNDLFGMIIRYDVSDTNVGNTPQYSGRISAVRWMSRDGSNSKTNERAYKYSYDALNRLTGAAYVERSVTGTGVFNLNTNGFNENGITYDENGNILTLKRRTSTVGGTTSKEVDNLNYSYDTDNPNQLSTVTDGVGVDYTGFGFRNITGSTVPYRYDANGNLIADHYKADTIAYNILNKTDRITITNATGRYISYTYNADGSVLRKQVYENGVIQSTTNYINGFVYNDGNLSYFSMPEGRVVKSGGTMQPEYVITDHQGNARFSFKDNGSGGIQILQENSFYAFGKTMPNSTVSLPSLPNINLYNGGSEWQNTFNDLPDYYQTFFRNYDPAIGRFIGVDPKAEATDELTTYNYTGNNPIMFNDPLGDQRYIPLERFSGDGLANFGNMDYAGQRWNSLMDKAGAMMDAMHAEQNRRDVAAFWNNIENIASGGSGGNVAGGGHNYIYVTNTGKAIKTVVDPSGPYGTSYYIGETTKSGGVKGLYEISEKQYVDIALKSTPAPGFYKPAEPLDFALGSASLAAELAGRSNITFRLTNGASNGSRVSPWIYRGGFRGGSRARITTYGIRGAGKMAGNALSIVSTGMAYNDILSGKGTTVTEVDATVGTIGLLSTAASYYAGIEVPYVGEAVAVYGTLRLAWDFGWYMGDHYGPTKLLGLR